jgi:3-keto-5-aminohexanoate cleavage enzyme
MVDIRDLYSGVTTGLAGELPHKTLAKKLVINIAPTGSFTSRQQNPGQPYTMQENVRAAVDAYKAGAAVWHVHARQADGLPSKEPKDLKETIDRVLDQCPDFLTSVIPYADYNAQGAEQIKPTVDYLCAAGPQYMRSAVLVITTTSFSEKFTYQVTESLLSGMIGYLERNGVKPEFQGHSYGALKDSYDWIISKGLASKPYLTNVMMGFHGFSHASPLGPDPWNYVYLMTMQQTLPHDALHGMCAGGRNWLAFATMGILLGFDYIRIGMEDSVYLHPHRDDKIRSNADMVRKLVEIAGALGREIATPAEAKEILGFNAMEKALAAARRPAGRSQVPA